MPVLDCIQDPEERTLTMIAHFAASPERVWQVWSDPRQLERWWGPPTWPATFEEHDLVVGGNASYYMTGPEGEKSRGYWRIVSVDQPSSIEFEDGFADESGSPNPKMPTTQVRVELAETDSGTRMKVTSLFATAEEMAKLAEMGMAEGMTLAMGQIDRILEEA